MENYDRDLEQILEIEQFEDQEEPEFNLQIDHGLDVECKSYWEQAAQREKEQQEAQLEIQQAIDQIRSPEKPEEDLEPLIRPIEDDMEIIEEIDNSVEIINYLDKHGRPRCCNMKPPRCWYG